MKTYTVILLCLIPALVSAQPLTELITAHPWSGSGTLMGSPAAFEMHWQWELDERFLKLEFKNSRQTADGREISFRAHAYYRVVGDSLLEGNWFDSRGVTFPLQGLIKGNEITVEWGSEETEMGRTVYVLKSPGEMAVTDYVFSDGRYSKFGEAAYKKSHEEKR